MVEKFSKTFFNAWTEVVHDRKDELLSNWDDYKLYTELIIKSSNSILLSVASLLNMKCYNKDYYSTDSVFYIPEDLVPEIPSDTFWFRNLRVAFEHENNFNSGLYQEVSHLLIINCELRVLVTYHDVKICEELKYLHRIISGNRSALEISDNEAFLIIIGHRDPYKWEGLVYKNNKDWKKL